MRLDIARLAALAAATTLIAAACSDGDTPRAAATTTPAAAAASTAAPSARADSAETTAAAPAGGGAVSGQRALVLGGEAIELDEVLCHLESQPAAGVGGNIEFVVQGHGRNDAGEPVMIDISRYDGESMFPGDAVQLYVGEIASDAAEEYSAQLPVGAVNLDGSTARAEDLALTDLDTSTDVVVSFVIAC